MAAVNGFSVEPYGSGQLGTFTVPGTSVKLSLRREVAPLLLAFARDWHTQVEPLTPGTCWGHAYRPVRGGRSWSLHSAGIAVDLNAPRHPLGKVGTFRPEQVAAIRALLAKYRGVLRWGGNYTGRKDEMHVEIIAPRGKALEVQTLVTAPARPRPPARPVPGPAVNRSRAATRARVRYEPYRRGQKPGSRTVRLGNAGDDVRFVQRWIGPARCGAADGYFGQRTHDAVRWYQQVRRVGVDGVVGPKTWAQMGIHPR